MFSSCNPKFFAVRHILTELLCFISNKMDIMTEDLLVKLCADFYSKNVIEAAKRLLFDLCRSVRVDIDLPIGRLGDKVQKRKMLTSSTLSDYVTRWGVSCRFSWHETSPAFRLSQPIASKCPRFYGTWKT